jgi:hypothetical protein
VLLWDNQEENFALDMIDKYGYPAWNSAAIAFDTADYTTRLPQIPLAKTDENFTRAWLLAHPGLEYDEEESWYVFLITRADVDSLILTDSSHNVPGLAYDVVRFLKFDETLFGTEDDALLSWFHGYSSEGFKPEEESLSGRSRTTTVCQTKCVPHAFAPKNLKNEGAEILNLNRLFIKKFKSEIV